MHDGLKLQIWAPAYILGPAHEGLNMGLPFIGITAA